MVWVINVKNRGGSGVRLRSGTSRCATPNLSTCPFAFSTIRAPLGQKGAAALSRGARRVRPCSSLSELTFGSSGSAKPRSRGADPSVSPGPGSDPGSEDCSKLKSTLSLKDKTPVLGRFHFLAAYTDNHFLSSFLGLSSSVWAKLTETQTGLEVTQFNKMNGTCIKSKVNVTISGDTAKAEMYNVTNEFRFLNFSSTSLIMELSASISSITDLMQKLSLELKPHLGPEFQIDQNNSQDPSNGTGGLTVQNFYLMSREAKVSETDLQRFKDLASCAGFTRDPDFKSSGEDYCPEEGSIQFH